MSNFSCPDCGTLLIDTRLGYITGCPPECGKYPREVDLNLVTTRALTRYCQNEDIELGDSGPQIVAFVIDFLDNLRG